MIWEIGVSRLVVITGASHVGKSTLAKRLSEALPGLSVHEFDDLLDDSVDSDFPEEGIEATFTALRRNVKADLLARRGIVIAVTTFTIVPRRKSGRYLYSELESLVEIAREVGAKVEIFRLVVSLSQIIKRGTKTKRLPISVILRVWFAERAGAKKMNLQKYQPDEALHTILQSGATDA